ncbi:hypothetical protein [Limibacillus halophilus]|uniref:Uncharacterized protein n=1 Tax=Limibacillus halophilus TaxID=1579333 RepID=A0A839SP38_9PROT|nr:hypothetical protein [Limibacillus halophilus]MBB3063958.1 hypothetical protein [Limibacillus halophilus]
MDIERINSSSAGLAIIGWFAGLSYYNWLASDPTSMPIWAHAVLVIGGMFFASIVIGGGLALLAAGLTRALTGKMDGSSDVFSSMAFVSPVVAFFAAKYGLGLFQ